MGFYNNQKMHSWSHIQSFLTRADSLCLGCSFSLFTDGMIKVPLGLFSVQCLVNRCSWVYLGIGLG